MAGMDTQNNSFQNNSFSDALKEAVKSLSKKQQVQMIRDHLYTKYEVFKKFKPLAIRIDIDLVKALPQYDSKLILRALSTHCRRPKYLAMLEKGGRRYDLKNRPAGFVTEEEQSIAAQKSKELLEKYEAKLEVKRKNAPEGAKIPKPKDYAAEAERPNRGKGPGNRKNHRLGAAARPRGNFQGRDAKGSADASPRDPTPLAANRAENAAKAAETAQTVDAAANHSLSSALAAAGLAGGADAARKPRAEDSAPNVPESKDAAPTAAPAAPEGGESPAE